MSHALATPLARLLRLVLLLATTSVPVIVGAPTVMAQAPVPSSPIVQIMPRDMTVIGGTSVNVVFWLCGDAWGYDVSRLSIEVNNVDVTSNFAPSYGAEPDWVYRKCTWKQQYTGTVSLTDQSNYFSVRVQPNNPATWEGSDWVTYDLPAPARGVSVTTGAMYATAAPSAVASRIFNVANTASATDTFALTLSCTGQNGTCTKSGGSSVILAGGQSTAITVSVPMPATVGAMAVARLVARSNSNPVMVDSSWTELTATTAPSQGVVLASTPDYLDRGLCTRVAVIGGDIECGDLLIDHPLPPLQSMTRTWAPLLLYNSQTAAPSPIIAANVTVSGSQPDSVTARVVYKGVQVATGKWVGSQWGANGTRRIALGWNATSDPTGAYAYTFEVSRWNGGTRTVIGSPSGTIALVNRSASPFGAGWWLDGLESLYETNDATGNKLWVGGDGSAHVYVTAGTNIWVARAVVAPDTLVRVGSTYSRRLPGGGQVNFDLTLRETSAINRNGWGTYYDYDGGGRLWKIRLRTPAGNGAAMGYTLTYGTNSVAVAAHGVGLTRTSTVTLSSGVVTAITDPDSYAEYFEGSPTQAARTVARTDKRGTRTAYSYAAGFTVSGASTPASPSQTMAVAYVDARTRGLVVTSGTGTAQLLDSTYSKYDGPRSDVSDISSFWENALGAPVRVRSTMGGETKVTYSSIWLGVPTEMRDAARLVSTSTIDAATGLVLSTTSANAFNDGRNQTTTYTWNTGWRAPTLVKNPAGDSTTFGYDAHGNRSWQQAGPNAGRRVTFAYDTLGLVTSVDAPLLPASTIAYDTLGNMVAMTTPAGWTTTVARDGFGRDTLTTSPIDTTHSSVVRTEYDVMSRVAATTTRGPAMNGAAADSVRLAYTYDAESNRKSTKRWFSWNGTWEYLLHTWTFDSIGRLTQQVDDNGHATSFAYDPAGNVVTRTSNRGTTVSSTYDAMNRPLRQVHSTVNYGSFICQLVSGFMCNYTFPTRGSSILITPDTAVFGYDLAGRLTSANNRYARIGRTYAPNGALTTDVLRIRRLRTVAPSPGDNVEDPVAAPIPFFPPEWYGGPGIWQQSLPIHGGGVIGGPVQFPAPVIGHGLAGRLPGGGSPGMGSPGGVGIASVANGGISASDATSVGVDEDFYQHVYTTRYHYDLDGRRDTLYFPFWGKWQSYAYSTTTGALSGIVDALGYSHTLTRDSLDRVTVQTSPGWQVTNGYDADDHLVDYNGVALTVDVLGRVTHAGTGAGPIFEYDGLGRVTLAQDNDANGTLESFTYDPLGNRKSSHRGVSNPSAGDDGIRTIASSYSGQVTQVASNLAHQMYYFLEQDFEYDLSGNASREQGREQTANYNHYWENYSYYGADEKLRIFDQHTGITDPAEMFGAGRRHSVFEEYWYDALGRRILMRSRYDRGCTPTVDTGCYSSTKRYIWDGDQLLHEIRADGRDSMPDSESDGWFVTYTHLAGLDAPVAVMKGWDSMVIPHRNWRAIADTGHAVVGALPAIDWPGRTQTLDQAPRGLPYVAYEWYGDLIGGNRDGSGQKYMRNRYYDPAKGTFSQADPIGLAGGINLYGYAGGDPVNYSDPFGLWPVVPFGPNSVTLLVYQAAERRLGELAHQVRMKLDGLIQGIMVGAIAGGVGRSTAGAAVAAEEGVYVGATETRVSRWMSEGEYKSMKATGTLQTDGRTFVTMPGAPKPGGTGPVRVDFNVPSDALKQAGREDWRVLYDPKKTPVTGIERVNP